MRWWMEGSMGPDQANNQSAYDPGAISAFALGHVLSGAGLGPILAAAGSLAISRDAWGALVLAGSVCGVGLAFTVTNTAGFAAGVRGSNRDDLTWLRRLARSSLWAGAAAAAALPLVGLMTEPLLHNVSRLGLPGSVLWVACNLGCAAVGSYLLGLYVMARTLRNAAGFPVVARRVNDE
jgi:hypothetical protein